MFKLVLKSPNGEWPITYMYTLSIITALCRGVKIQDAIINGIHVKNITYLFPQVMVLNKSISRYQMQIALQLEQA